MDLKPLRAYRGPDFRPNAEWHPAPKGYMPVAWGSVYPPLQKLPDGRLIIDQCRKADGTYEVRIFDNKDHPNIAVLPKGAPNAVVALYKRSNQLAMLRMTSLSGFTKQLRDAAEAWDRFEGVA